MLAITTPDPLGLLDRFAVTSGRYPQWKAWCPVGHPPPAIKRLHRPSLSIGLGDVQWRLTCHHAGCSLTKVLRAAGLTVADLRYDRAGRPPPPPTALTAPRLLASRPVRRIALPADRRTTDRQRLARQERLVQAALLAAEQAGTSTSIRALAAVLPGLSRMTIARTKQRLLLSEVLDS